MAENVLSGKVDSITPTEFLNYNMENTTLLDVRSSIEFNSGHLKGAINIPVDNLRERLGELDRNKEIIAYCKVGLRGYIASRILSQYGFKVKNITGGYKSISALSFSPPKQDKNRNTPQRKLSDSNTHTVKEEEIALDKSNYDKSLDACGLCCPGPLMQVKKTMDDLKEGQILKVIASDPGFYEDIKAWCQRTNNELVDLNKDKSNITALIKKKVLKSK